MRTALQRSDRLDAQEQTVQLDRLRSPHLGEQDAEGRRLLAALERMGFAYVRVGAAEERVAAAATAEAIAFFARPHAEKLTARCAFADGKFLGYADQGLRQFVQVRAPPPGLDFPWPRAAAAGEGGAAEHAGGGASSPLADRVVPLYAMLSEVSRLCLRRLCRASAVGPRAAGGDGAAQHAWLREEEVFALLEADGACEARLARRGAAPADHSTPAPAPGGAAAAASGVGADVLRVYQYLRPAGTRPPGLAGAATGVHADMGLLTAAPAASLPGLMVLSPDGVQWLDVESSLSAEGRGQAPGAESPVAPASSGGDGAGAGGGGEGHASWSESDDETSSEASSEASNKAPDEGAAAGPAPRAGGTGAEAIGGEPALAEAEAKEGNGSNDTTARHDRIIVFVGDTLDPSQVMGAPRISLPFFVRARPDAPLAPLPGDPREPFTIGDYMREVVMHSRPWVRPPLPPPRRLAWLRRAPAPGGSAKWGIAQRGDF